MLHNVRKNPTTRVPNSYPPLTFRLYIFIVFSICICFCICFSISSVFVYKVSERGRRAALFGRRDFWEKEAEAQNSALQWESGPLIFEQFDINQIIRNWTINQSIEQSEI